MHDAVYNLKETTTWHFINSFFPSNFFLALTLYSTTSLYTITFSTICALHFPNLFNCTITIKVVGNERFRHYFMYSGPSIFYNPLF